MNRDIGEAISELNGDIDELIMGGEEKVKKAENDHDNSNGNYGNRAMPLSKNLEGDGRSKSAFGEYIRSGIGDFLKKSLSDKDECCGAYFIPYEISLQINDKLKLLSPMRSISKTISISSNSVELLVDSKAPDAGWMARSEEERIETDAPEIKKITIPVHEVYAKPMVNQKLLDDAQVNVEEWLMTKVAEKIAALENAAFVNGDGKEKPLGFLSVESEAKEEREAGKLQHFHSGAAGGFAEEAVASDILIDMVCSLKPIYVRNAKWIMSRSALAEIRKLKGKDGSYLWQPALSKFTPSTLLGYPVVIDDDMPAISRGKATISVAFGDFYHGYQIVDRQGLKILRDPYTSKPFVEFYATKRIGGGVVDFDAIKLLKFDEKAE
ncbi:MAG: phage major capsid protein [Holosporaceae bacterium]|jgi:HK97 family phage major capsid protein|nr:phage major capsid protein [Holosporaceae bacterium]